MKRFQPNPAFYSENYDGYTSSDEFDLETRVHVTNELPPQDLYDMAHSMIKNDLWKWFFGSSFISYDVSYNEDTDGVEKIDQEGYLIEASISKYVNGVRARDFGPRPQYVWNPNYKKDFQEYKDFVGDEKVDDPLTEDDFKWKVNYSKEYRRIELDGVLLPEFDLMLHEAYRYLKYLYPNHPDFTKILTLNEFNDEIMQAGAIIDYIPNFKYFEWLAGKLDYSCLSAYDRKNHYSEIVYDESSKLKIRNLMNYAFRKKFFGSKSGYKQFTAGALQHASVMASAQYVPFETVASIENKDYLIDEKWHHKMEKQPKTFVERVKNTSHALYGKFFRLIDWTNSSYDFLHRYKEPAAFYGTAYPTPYSQFALYEYPLQRVIDKLEFSEGKDGLITYLTMANDFKAGQRVKINGQNSDWQDFLVAHINSIQKTDSYSVKAKVGYDADGNLMPQASEFIQSINTGAVTKVDIDTDIQPVYTPLTVYSSNDRILDWIFEHDSHYTKEEQLPRRLRYEQTDILKKYYEALKVDFNESTKELHAAVFKEDGSILKKFESFKIPYRAPKVGKFTLDPLQNGCLHMAPQQFITVYSDELNIDLDISPWLDEEEKEPVSAIEYAATTMSDEGYVQKMDNLVFDNGRKRFMATVLDIGNAYVQFELDGKLSQYEEITKAVEEANNTETARHGIVIKLSDSNVFAGGKQVVLFGQPHFGEVVEKDRYFITPSVYFDIKAIPRIKSHETLLTVYSNFLQLAEKKYEALKFLIGSGPGGSEYNKLFELVEKIEIKYADFLEAVDGLNEAFDKGLLFYNNKDWQKFDKAALAVIPTFETRPVLVRQLTDFYSDWFERNNKKDTSLPDRETFSKEIQLIENTFTEYYDEFKSWIVGEIAILLDRKHYELIDGKNLDKDYRNAFNTLVSIDATLFETMLPNRAFLLNPLPEDLLMLEEDEKEMSYALRTSEDKFVSILSVTKNDKYDDQLRWKVEQIFGASGYLKNTLSVEHDAWSFGSLNTATVVETHYDETSEDFVTEDVLEKPGVVDFLEDYYESSADFVRKYVLEDRHGEYEEGETPDTIEYFSLNQDIITLMEATDDAHKFSYADPNFLEAFLPDEYKNNVRGEVVDYNIVKINCHFVEGSYEATFEEEAAMDAMQYLATGDQVTGFTIADDTFIESIDLENYKIRVSKPFYITDEAVLEFLCRIQYCPEDVSKDFFAYRVRASRDGMASKGTVFGDSYTDSISQHVFSSYIDAEDFKVSLTENLQNLERFRDKFNSFVSYLYQKEGLPVTAPSAIKFDNKVFLDINAYTRFTDVDQDFIMSQKTLDYFEGYVEDISKVSDDVSIGASVNVFGKINIVTEDDAIGLKFVTTKFWRNMTPYYIKIGTGRLDDIFNLEEEEEVKSRSENRSYYGEAVYGDAVYSGDAISKVNDEGRVFSDIDKPLFKVQLGEYEVQNNIEFDDFGGSRNFTTVQFAVLRRQVENMKIDFQYDFNQDFTFSTDIIIDWPLSAYTLEDGDRELKVLDASNQKKFEYLGETIIQKNAKGEVVLPDAPFNTEKFYYYAITKDTEVDDKKYYNGDILIWTSDGWQHRRMATLGFYGDTKTLSKDLEYLDPNNEMVVTVSNSISINNDLDLRAALLYKICRSLKIGNLTATYTPKGKYAELLRTYEQEAGDYKDYSYIFMFTGFQGLDFSKIGLKYGDLIGMVYINEQVGFILTKIRKSMFTILSETDKSMFSEQEFESFTGNLFSTESGILYKELLNPLTFQLNGLTDIVKGTVDTRLKFCAEKTIGTGFLVLEDGSVDYNEEHEINLTENDIIPDESIERLTVMNGDKKYAIKQENNKYFKNIINNIVQYNKESSISSDGLKNFGTLTGITGFNFDTDKMTMYDRYIDIEKVNIRSPWSNNLEPTLFSKHTLVTASMKGFDISSAFDENYHYNVENGPLVLSEDDITDKSIVLSYRSSIGVRNEINRAEFINEILKINPMDADGNLLERDIVDFGETLFNDKIVKVPTSLNAEIYDENDILGDIKWLKNNLVIEADVDLSKPTEITVSTLKSTNALQKISISDKVTECYPLTAPKTNAYITFDEPEFKNAKDALLCDNFLVLVRDDGISVFYCEDIMKFTPSIKKSFSIQDIKTVSSGPGEIICSAAWDKEDQYLILSFSNDALTENLGVAYFKIALDASNNIICEQDDSMTPVSGTGTDINTYQLVKVLSTQDEDKAKLMVYQNEDGEWLNDLEVFSSDEETEERAGFCARDLAFIDVDVTEGAPLFEQKSVTEDILISNAILKDSENNNPPNKVLEMKLSIEDATQEDSKVAFTGNNGAFLYDNITAKWVYVTISELSTLLEGNHGKEAIKSTVYIVDNDVLEYSKTHYEVAAHGQAYTEGYANRDERAQEQYAAQFLWQLPRPVTENELIMVVVYKRADKQQLKMTVKKCTLKNVVIKPFDVIDTDPDGKLYSLTQEGNKRPKISINYKLGAYAVDTAKPTFFASNNEGMLAAVNGDNLFLKTPTMRWSKSENGTGFESYNYTSPTSFYMWKRAKLPNVRDLSYLLFDIQTPEEAYELVKSQRQFILNNEPILKNDEISRMILDFLRSEDFVIYSPEEYIDKHDENAAPGGIFESGLSIKGVKFVTTAQGRVANFGKDYAQTYENIIGVEVQQGVTVKATLLRQVYMNYLSDLYHLVLCQNRLIDIAEYGIKALRMTSSSVIIVTQSDDILTLDISNTYTRDDIENPYNWEVQSLNDALEYPLLNVRDNDGVIFTVGKDGEYKTLRNQIAAVTNKAYKINTWYFDDKVQFFGGAFSVDDNFKNYLKSVYDNNDSAVEEVPSVIQQILDQSDITAGVTYPFIAYSADGGQSYEFDIISGNPYIGFSARSLFKESGTYVYGLTDGNNNVKFGYYANVADSGTVLERYEGSNTADDDVNKNRINWTNSKPLTVANCLTTPEVFYLENYSLSWLTGTVTAVSNSSFTIKLDSVVTPRLQSEFVNVLLALETTNQIRETREFLDYNPKYFNQIGKLFVNEYTEVDSRHTADRAYSQNEVRKVSEQSKTAFPGLCDDVSRSIFEYEERVDYTGKTIYVPVECTNTEGNTIRLYDVERGVYLFTRNAGTDTLNSYTTQRMLRDNISVDLVIPMIKVQEDFSFVVKNENLRDLLLAKDGTKYELQIEQYDKSISTMKLVPTVPRDIIDSLKYEGDAYYEWPWKDGEIPDETAFIDTLRNFTETEPGKVAFVRKLSALLDEDEKFSKTFSMYYAPVKMSLGTATFWGVAQLDLETNRPAYLLLQEQRLVMDVTTPYIAASLKTYDNFNMPLVTEDKLTYFDKVRNETINSIFYGHTGYGAFFNTKEDDVTFPWKRDTVLFHNTLLTNDAGENVYIADKNGENILTKNGLFFLRNGDSTEITYDNLRSGKTKLVLKKDAYESPSIKYNLFKREMEFSVYVPSENATFLNSKKDGDGNTVLSVLKVYEDDFEVSPERVEKEYAITLLTAVYEDEECTVEHDTKFKYSDRKLLYTKGNKKNLFTIGDTLSVKVTRLKDGKSQTVTFSIVQDEDFCTIESIDRFEYLDQMSSGKVAITCDKEGTVAYSTVEGIDSLTDMSFNLTTGDTDATFNIAGYQYKFDIRKFEPELLLNRDWFTSSEVAVPYRIYSKSNNLTDRYNVTFTLNENEETGEWTMTVTVINKTSELTLTEVEIPMAELGDLENMYAFADANLYVYVEDDKNTLFNIEDDGSSLLVEGIYGECLSLVPKYESFKDVIDNLGRIYKTGNKVACDGIKISAVTNTKVSFEDLIEGVEDGESINVKILPINTVLLSESLMNNPDYFTEVGVDDLALFSYDRVWVNEKVNKKPVINLDGNFYHTESLSEYAISDWRNKDNFLVFLADKSGRYTKAIVSGGEIRYQVIGDEYGDCSEEIYQSTDVRINPYEALYKTSYDKYMNMYYDPRKIYNNPFYKYVKFQDIVKEGEIVNDTYLGVPLKVNGLVTLVDDTDFFVRPLYEYVRVLDQVQLNEKNPVDYLEGTVSIQIESSQNSDEEKVLAGIVYKNPFKYDELPQVRLNVFTENDFVIDSTEDVSNKEKSCIENITEMGIFSRSGVLIAYAAHPIVQYDTKKNHIAYNVIVDNA